MSYLTEKEAWLKLAEFWSKDGKMDREYCTYQVQIASDYEASGLCPSCDILYTVSLIDMTTYKAMMSKITLERESHVGGYGFNNLWIWPVTKEGAPMRVAFCRAMAEAIS